jgi:hypothetical protein
MPAVLIIEAMAQTGGVMLLNTVDDPKKYLVYFTRVDKAKFRRPVVPGDQLRFELEMKSLRRNHQARPRPPCRVPSCYTEGQSLPGYNVSRRGKKILFHPGFQ